MRRSRVPALAFALATIGPFLLAAPAAAFQLTDCTLTASALDASGGPIDSVAGGQVDSTEASPFLVDHDGTVQWSGTTGSLVLKDHHWHIDLFGAPTPLQGGDTNAAGDTAGEGSIGVSTNLPFEVVGVFYVSGAIVGDGGSCEGSGWVKLRGDPLGTVPFFVAAGAAIVGLLMLISAASGAWPLGIFGGLLVGVAMALSAIMYAFVPLGVPTPWVIVAAATVAGLLFGITMRKPGAPPAVA